MNSVEAAVFLTRLWGKEVSKQSVSFYVRRGYLTNVSTSERKIEVGEDQLRTLQARLNRPGRPAGKYTYTGRILKRKENGGG